MMRRWGIWMVALGGLLLAVMLWPPARARLAANGVGLLALRAQAGMPAPDGMTKTLLEQAHNDCQAAWLAGFLYQAQNDRAARDAAWKQAARCDEKFIPLLQARLPEDRALAEDILAEHQDVASAWFWAANAMTHWVMGRLEPVVESDRTQAIEDYRRGLALDPANGARWRELGDLYAPVDLQEALQAYVQSCGLVDPLSHSCGQAASVYVQLGDIPNAIRYFRLSPWDWDRQKAAELESRLTPTPVP
jgi:tetratricopeptide (TPR) repeat protein